MSENGSNTAPLWRLLEEREADSTSSLLTRRIIQQLNIQVFALNFGVIYRARGAVDASGLYHQSEAGRD
jgi:hypothetical protein